MTGPEHERSILVYVVSGTGGHWVRRDQAPAWLLATAHEDDDE